MIIDTLHNALKYFSVHPSFEKAFQFISSTDIAHMPPGKFDIDGQLKAAFSAKKGKTAAESTASFECHNAHIDIQVCIAGEEEIGWKPREKCVNEKGAYNTEKDVQLYDDAPDMYFRLQPGQFVIFFPEDVHAPMIGTEEIKKLVIKVKL